MTDWTARIDALLAEKPRVEDYEDTDHECEWDWDYPEWLEKCLAHAAERMREPHEWDCDVYVILNDCDDLPEHGPCTCGKDDDLRRILEGK